jgi:histidinol dehydrogenase
MKGPLRVLKADSRAGRKALARLTRRADAVLDPATGRRARKIVDRIRRKGDRALLDAVRRLDGFASESVAELEWSAREGSEPVDRDRLPLDFEDALETAIAAVESYHRHQVHEGYRLEEDGVELEERRTPLERVGLYVPGGRASYPSTAVMTAVPARVAGVRQIVVATPPATLFAQDGPLGAAGAVLRYTLRRLGVDEVWGMGGAHAVAALAYGTQTVRRVDKIVGPGNAWVTAAKSLVAGDVAIDGVAGPSEVVIVADAGPEDGAPADRIEQTAADLLAQAEHDPRAAAVLITGDAGFAREVARRVAARLPDLATEETARESLERFGAAFVVRSLDDALPLIEALAPEHLQLVGPGAEALAGRGLPVGALFVGSDTPEVFGDYVAGPSHVLPTCGTARFASALGVEDFVRRSHVIRYSREAARRSAPVAAVFADAEGLPAHAQSARLRARTRSGRGSRPGSGGGPASEEETR